MHPTVFAVKHPSNNITFVVVSAFVATSMDYCNSILAELPQSSIDPLQRVQILECGRQTHHRHRNTRTHHSRTTESALASSWVSHNFQTVSTHASGAHRPCSCLPVRHACMVTATADLSTQICEHSSIQTSVIETKFRWKKLLLRRT